MAVTVPVWLAWIMAAVVLNESFHQACVGELRLRLGKELVVEEPFHGVHMKQM